jgi:hypothetical protein
MVSLDMVVAAGLTIHTHSLTLRRFCVKLGCSATGVLSYLRTRNAKVKNASEAANSTMSTVQSAIMLPTLGRIALGAVGQSGGCDVSSRGALTDSTPLLGTIVSSEMSEVPGDADAAG